MFERNDQTPTVHSHRWESARWKSPDQGFMVLKAGYKKSPPSPLPLVISWKPYFFPLCVLKRSLSNRWRFRIGSSKIWEHTCKKGFGGLNKKNPFSNQNILAQQLPTHQKGFKVMKTIRGMREGKKKKKKRDNNFLCCQTSPVLLNHQLNSHWYLSSILPIHLCHLLGQRNPLPHSPQHSWRSAGEPGILVPVILKGPKTFQIPIR